MSAESWVGEKNYDSERIIDIGYSEAVKVIYIRAYIHGDFARSVRDVNRIFSTLYTHICLTNKLKSFINCQASS